MKWVEVIKALFVVFILLVQLARLLFPSVEVLLKKIHGMSWKNIFGCRFAKTKVKRSKTVIGKYFSHWKKILFVWKNNIFLHWSRCYGRWIHRTHYKFWFLCLQVHPSDEFLIWRARRWCLRPACHRRISAMLSRTRCVRQLFSHKPPPLQHLP